MRTLKQFQISFNSLAKKIDAQCDKIELATARLRIMPNDRHAKKAVTMTEKTLYGLQRDLMRFMCDEMAIRICTTFVNPHINLAVSPTWRRRMQEEAPSAPEAIAINKISVYSLIDDNTGTYDVIDSNVDDLHEGVTLLFRTRTNEVDGIESVEGNLTYDGCTITVFNGIEFRTGRRETRTMFVKCKRTTANRLIRLLCK